MDLYRYIHINKCIRGFSLEGRIIEDDSNETWMKRGKMLSQLEAIEKMILRSQYVTTLLNKCGSVLVIDDKLISSRADDVETKTISNRKTGKEGPVSDCVA